MKRKEFISKISKSAILSIGLPSLISCELNQEKISGLKNWSGNYTYSAKETKFVNSIEELKNKIVSSKKIKALGTQHCFNDIADTNGTQFSTKNLNSVIELNEKEKYVMVLSGIKYGELGQYLNQRGWALNNLASLPHISVGGACATATHGSGVFNGNLASSVLGFELLTSSGEIFWVDPIKNSDLFFGGVVSLGAIGIITKIKLRIENTFDVEQYVFENLPMDVLKKNFLDIMKSGYSVSFFTHWLDRNINQIWIKSKSGDFLNLKNSFFGASPANRDLHPIKTNSAINCTPQMGISGPWHERLPHFKMNFTPSNGDELQSEYFVPISMAYEAIMSIESLKDKISPILFVTEIRSIAADNFWMSPTFERDSISIHFTWKPMGKEVLSILPEIESKLKPFMARPHWGKIHGFNSTNLKSVYPMYDRFVSLIKEIDPKEALINSYLNRGFEI